MRSNPSDTSTTQIAEAYITATPVEQPSSGASTATAVLIGRSFATTGRTATVVVRFVPRPNTDPSPNKSTT